MHRAWSGGFAVSSNYARYAAPYIAAAASKGLITSRTRDGYGTTWRVTLKGLELLWKEMK